MMDEATIRQKIQEKLQHGALPIHAQSAPEASLYSHEGQGTGEPCSACDEPIAPHEERVIYAADANQIIQLHARCEQLWHEVRTCDLGGRASAGGEGLPQAAAIVSDQELSGGTRPEADQTGETIPMPPPPAVPGRLEGEGEEPGQARDGR